MGVLPLGSVDGEDKFEFLIFGGAVGRLDEEMSDETYRFCTDLQNPKSGDLQLVSKMSVMDRFYLNQTFPIDTEHISNGCLSITKDKLELINELKNKKCELIGVAGRHAFHVFDKTHNTWISHTESLGYVTISRQKRGKKNVKEEP